MPIVAAYVASLAAFMAMDFCWLSLTASRLYRPAIGELLADKVSVAPGALFYLLYIGGVVALAVVPAFRAGSWMRAAWAGAVLGLVAYGTYDLTNQATLKVWATRLTLADMGWGTVVTTIAALVGLFAARAASRMLGDG